MGIRNACDRMEALKTIIGLKPKAFYPDGIEGLVQEAIDRAIVHTLDEALLIIREECPEVLEEEMENETVVETPRQVSETSAMLRSVVERAKAHQWEIHYEIPERKIVANWEAMKPGDVIVLHTYSGYAVHGILFKSYKIGHYYLKIRLLGEFLPDEFFEEIGGWIVEKPTHGILANTGYHCVPWDAIREISAVETPTSEELDWKKKVIDAWEGYEEEEDER